jgi:site-specific DNA-methyltransferase (adenine-specific)
MNNECKNVFLNKIICGDSHFVLQKIPSLSVNLVITSPPYFQQRNYDGMGLGNEKQIDDYFINLSKVFSQCVRVLKQDGNIIFNIGDKYQSGSLLLAPYKFVIDVLKSNQIKLVNMITWSKPNPVPRQFKRRLVNSTEPFFHFVKTDSYYYDVNSFMSFDKLPTKINNESKIGLKYFSLIKQSNLSDSEKKRAEKELSEVIQETKSGKIHSFRMKIRGLQSEPFGGQNGGRKIQLKKKGFTIIKLLGNKLKKDLIECPVETIRGNKHPAVYPKYIVQELIKLLTKKGDVVLDPFVGSGTSAVAAKELGRNYIGIDINPNYCEYAEERLENVVDKI